MNITATEYKFIVDNQEKTITLSQFLKYISECTNWWTDDFEFVQDINPDDILLFHMMDEEQPYFATCKNNIRSLLDLVKQILLKHFDDTEEYLPMHEALIDHWENGSNDLASIDEVSEVTDEHICDLILLRLELSGYNDND